LALDWISAILCSLRWVAVEIGKSLKLAPFVTSESWTACYHQQMDRSNGYEAVSEEFLARRGNSRTRSNAIGVKDVRKWAKTLPRGSCVIDLGCGPGFPITHVLCEEGLQVFGVDAAPSFVAAFQRNLPGRPIVCESVLESRLFGRTFDAVLSIGLMFLLKAEEQHRLIQRFAEILVPGGRLLFTSPAKPAVWNDLMTGLESHSLGAEQYRKLLGAVGISVAEEYEDEGENHYFDAFKGKTA
jgi:SAM-dependent methyltransferase